MALQNFVNYIKKWFKKKPSFCESGLRSTEVQQTPHSGSINIITGTVDQLQNYSRLYGISGAGGLIADYAIGVQSIYMTRNELYSQYDGPGTLGASQSNLSGSLISGSTLIIEDLQAAYDRAMNIGMRVYRDSLIYGTGYCSPVVLGAEHGVTFDTPAPTILGMKYDSPDLYEEVKGFSGAL